MDLQRAAFVKIYTAVSLNSRVLTKGMGANIPGNPLLFILCDTEKILYKILDERALSKLLCFYGAFLSSCSAYLKVRATLSGLHYFFSWSALQLFRSSRRNSHPTCVPSALLSS